MNLAIHIVLFFDKKLATAAPFTTHYQFENKKVIKSKKLPKTWASGGT